MFNNYDCFLFSSMNILMAGDTPSAGTEAWKGMKLKEWEVWHLCLDKRGKGLADLNILLELR